MSYSGFGVSPGNASFVSSGRSRTPSFNQSTTFTPSLSSRIRLRIRSSPSISNFASTSTLLPPDFPPFLISFDVSESPLSTLRATIFNALQGLTNSTSTSNLDALNPTNLILQLEGFRLLDSTFSSDLLRDGDIVDVQTASRPPVPSLTDLPTLHSNIIKNRPSRSQRAQRKAQESLLGVIPAPLAHSDGKEGRKGLHRVVDSVGKDQQMTEKRIRGIRRKGRKGRKGKMEANEEIEEFQQIEQEEPPVASSSKLPSDKVKPPSDSESSSDSSSDADSSDSDSSSSASDSEEEEEDSNIQSEVARIKLLMRSELGLKSKKNTLNIEDEDYNDEVQDGGNDFQEDERDDPLGFPKPPASYSMTTPGNQASSSSSSGASSSRNTGFPMPAPSSIASGGGSMLPPLVPSGGGSGAGAALSAFDQAKKAQSRKLKCQDIFIISKGKGKQVNESKNPTNVTSKSNQASKQRKSNSSSSSSSSSSGDSSSSPSSSSSSDLSTSSSSSADSSSSSSDSSDSSDSEDDSPKAHVSKGLAPSSSSPSSQDPIKLHRSSTPPNGWVPPGKGSKTTKDKNLKRNENRKLKKAKARAEEFEMIKKRGRGHREEDSTEDGEGEGPSWKVAKEGDGSEGMSSAEAYRKLQASFSSVNASLLPPGGGSLGIDENVISNPFVVQSFKTTTSMPPPSLPASVSKAGSGSLEDIAMKMLSTQVTKASSGGKKSRARRAEKKAAEASDSFIFTQNETAEDLGDISTASHIQVEAPTEDPRFKEAKSGNQTLIVKRPMGKVPPPSERPQDEIPKRLKIVSVDCLEWYEKLLNGNLNSNQQNKEYEAGQEAARKRVRLMLEEESETLEMEPKTETDGDDVGMRISTETSNPSVVIPSFHSNKQQLPYNPKPSPQQPLVKGNGKRMQEETVELDYGSPDPEPIRSISSKPKPLAQLVPTPVPAATDSKIAQSDWNTATEQMEKIKAIRQAALDSMKLKKATSQQNENSVSVSNGAISKPEPTTVFAPGLNECLAIVSAWESRDQEQVKGNQVPFTFKPLTNLSDFNSISTGDSLVYETLVLDPILFVPSLKGDVARIESLELVEKGVEKGRAMTLDVWKVQLKCRCVEKGEVEGEVESRVENKTFRTDEGLKVWLVKGKVAS